MKKGGFVYILTNKYNTVFYIGVTSNLIKRIYEHKNNMHNGFTKKYNIHKFVYYEILENIKLAIAREKYLKGKGRKYKIDLINKLNPRFTDLYNSII